MPRSHSLSHYPSRYGEIIREVAVAGKRAEVPCDGQPTAAKLRGHFYAYVGALRREARGIKTAAPTAGEADILELSAQSAMVLVTIEILSDGRVGLVFQNRENSWQAKALEKVVLKDSMSKPTATTLDDGAARLAALQAAVDKPAS